MSGRLESKVLVVTGGTQGMGLAFAQRAARKGLASSSVPGTRTGAKRSPRRSGTRAVAPSSCPPTSRSRKNGAARRTAVTEYGRLDGAFNNAGGGPMASVRETDSDNWQRSLALNLTSVFYGLKYELPAIIASGGGAIVNNASVSGVKGDRTQAA